MSLLHIGELRQVAQRSILPTQNPPEFADQWDSDKQTCVLASGCSSYSSYAGNASWPLTVVLATVWYKKRFLRRVCVYRRAQTV